MIRKLRKITTNLLANESEYDRKELDDEVKKQKCTNINHYCKDLQETDSIIRKTFFGIEELQPILYSRMKIIELTRGSNIEISELEKCLLDGVVFHIERIYRIHKGNVKCKRLYARIQMFKM